MITFETYGAFLGSEGHVMNLLNSFIPEEYKLSWLIIAFCVILALFGFEITKKHGFSRGVIYFVISLFLINFLLPYFQDYIIYACAFGITLHLVLNFRYMRKTNVIIHFIFLWILSASLFGNVLVLAISAVIFFILGWILSKTHGSKMWGSPNELAMIKRHGFDYNDAMIAAKKQIGILRDADARSHNSLKPGFEKDVINDTEKGFQNLGRFELDEISTQIHTMALAASGEDIANSEARMMNAEAQLEKKELGIEGSLDQTSQSIISQAKKILNATSRSEAIELTKNVLVQGIKKLLSNLYDLVANQDHMEKYREDGLKNLQSANSVIKESAQNTRQLQREADKINDRLSKVGLKEIWKVRHEVRKRLAKFILNFILTVFWGITFALGSILRLIGLTEVPFRLLGRGIMSLGRLIYIPVVALVVAIIGLIAAGIGLYFYLSSGTGWMSFIGAIIVFGLFLLVPIGGIIMGISYPMKIIRTIGEKIFNKAKTKVAEKSKLAKQYGKEYAQMRIELTKINMMKHALWLVKRKQKKLIHWIENKAKEIITIEKESEKLQHTLYANEKHYQQDLKKAHEATTGFQRFYSWVISKADQTLPQEIMNETNGHINNIFTSITQICERAIDENKNIIFPFIKNTAKILKDAWGIESAKKYCDRAVQKLEQGYSQLDQMCLAVAGGGKAQKVINFQDFIAKEGEISNKFAARANKGVDNHFNRAHKDVMKAVEATKEQTAYLEKEKQGMDLRRQTVLNSIAHVSDVLVKHETKIHKEFTKDMASAMKGVTKASQGVSRAQKMASARAA
ncbi:hypothetical protein HN587_04165 [Candidatus Woesearchaeota archaeon]|jgi:hypothetical protein|nr:hypothetical protein [Candidatus Woesearchaeota archaeon]